MDDIERELRKELNKRGYGFEEAVTRRCEELSRKGESGWVFEAREFPVRVGSRDTRIDLVMKGPDARTYLVGECKRVDPKLGRWGFARSTYTRRDASSREVSFERLVSTDDGLRSEPWVGSIADGPYHIYVPFKAPETGDGTGSGREDIEGACSQVLLGSSGLCDLMASREGLPRNNTSVMVVPVIFTTAEVWVTEASVAGADLTTGNIESVGEGLEQRGWIWLNYNTSWSFRHSVVPGAEASELYDLIHRDLTRTVAVVSPSGLDEFLRKGLHTWG